MKVSAANYCIGALNSLSSHGYNLKSQLNDSDLQEFLLVVISRTDPIGGYLDVLQHTADPSRPSHTTAFPPSLVLLMAMVSIFAMSYNSTLLITPYNATPRRHQGFIEASFLQRFTNAVPLSHLYRHLYSKNSSTVWELLGRTLCWIHQGAPVGKSAYPSKRFARLTPYQDQITTGGPS